MHISFLPANLSVSPVISVSIDKEQKEKPLCRRHSKQQEISIPVVQLYNRCQKMLHNNTGAVARQPTQAY
jgi:hypothetical protein